MWNPFKNRRIRRRARELRDTTRTFTILEAFARRGMLFWKEKDNILLIEESLATVELARGPKKFRLFLAQVAAWQHFRLLQKAYEAHRLDVETKAVREATKDKKKKLSDADIQRIRQEARANLPELDPETLTFPREFDIFILSAKAQSAKDATQKGGELLAVGHYDGENVEMAMYRDVRDTVFKRKRKDDEE